MAITWDLPAANFIRLDMFPAIVRGLPFPNGVIDRQRLIVTDAHIYLFGDTANGPAVTYSWVLEDISGRNTTGYKMITEDGEVIEARRSNGCGCGSRLRGIRPFPDTPYDTRINA